MEKLNDLLKEKRNDDIWKKYCGFLDYTLKDFMNLQEDMLLEQLDRLKHCTIGKQIIGTKVPKSVDEFREKVKFTGYKHYSKYLMNKEETVLPEKPITWAHTSGRSGEYQFKWAPYTEEMFRVSGEKSCTALILSSCKNRGDIVLKEEDKVLFTVATPPYVSGIWIQGAMAEFNMKMFPPYENALKMDFHERIKVGLKSALSEGLDLVFGMTSILVKIGEQIGNRDSKNRGEKNSESSIGIQAILRLLQAYVKAKCNGRKVTPKDIWKLKGIVCGGMDTSIYKNKVKQLWGKIPLETYGSTEFGFIAVQPWNCEHMVLYPDVAYWEFICIDDYQKMKSDASYAPKTMLINEVKANEEYVLVGTSYHGGVFIRYIIGDLIKIVSLNDKEAQLNLPQLVCIARVDDLIDIGGFTRLTEKIIWQAIEDTGLSYTDWTIRKEYNESKPILHLYLELKDSNETSKTVTNKVHESLRMIDEPYRELERIAGVKPLKVSLLKKGSFQRFYEERVAAGADLAHLKPKHINPQDNALKNLLRMSSWEL